MRTLPLLRSRRTRFACALLSLALLVPAAAQAAHFQHGHDAVIGPNDVIDDDLYIAGGTVEIRGRVNGDVVASGGTVLVNGEVTGNLFTFSGNAVVTGHVGGSMRSAGGNVTLSGTVDHDVVVGCGRLLVSPGAQVGRDLVAGAGNSDLLGKVARNGWLAGGELEIGGSFGGDVNAEARSISLADGAAIEGALRYASRHEMKRAPGATVRGEIVQSALREGHRRGPLGLLVMAALGWARSVIGWTAFGLLLLLPFPERARRFLATLAGEPGKSLGIGVVLFAVVPFAAAIVFILGVLIGGWWIAFMAMSLLAVLFALGFAGAGYFGGQWLAGLLGGPTLHRALALLLGVLLLTLVTRVPVLGGLGCLLAACFGAGAVALSLTRPGPAPGAAAAG